MENKVSDYRKYYLREFSLFDTDHFIIFNIVDIDLNKNEITLAITNEGRLSVCSFDLKKDGKRFYFEYGIYAKKIGINEFEQIGDEL